MILYNHTDWWGTLFHPQSSLWTSLLRPSGLVLLWSAISYYICQKYEVKASPNGQAIIGCFLTFILIFRCQQSSQRYLYGKTAISMLSHTATDLVGGFTFYMRGIHEKDAGEDQAKSAAEAVVNIVRLTVCYMVSILIYTRVGWLYSAHSRIKTSTKKHLDLDRSRLRGLLSEKEFMVLDRMLGAHEYEPEAPKNNWFSSCWNSSAVYKHGHYRIHKEQIQNDVDNQTNLPVVIATWLRLEIIRHCGKPYGYIERALNLLDLKVERLLFHYQEINENITMPFPIQYSQLCKLLMICFILGCPYIIDTSLGVFANIYFPTLIAVCIFGVEHIAVALELPFGDDKETDLNVSDAVHQLECECMEILKATGLDLAAAHFQFVDAPAEYEAQGWYLCLRSEREAAKKTRDGPWDRDHRERMVAMENGRRDL